MATCAFCKQEIKGLASSFKPPWAKDDVPLCATCITNAKALTTQLAFSLTDAGVKPATIMTGYEALKKGSDMVRGALDLWKTLRPAAPLPPVDPVK